MGIVGDEGEIGWQARIRRIPPVCPMQSAIRSVHANGPESRRVRVLSRDIDDHSRARQPRSLRSWPSVTQTTQPAVGLRNGLFVFTLEHAVRADSGVDYRLEFHGRYSHTRIYDRLFRLRITVAIAPHS